MRSTSKPSANRRSVTESVQSLPCVRWPEYVVSAPSSGGPVKDYEKARRVFAFRLIARDTVEEKVLELQRTKRALADALLGAGADLVRTLQKEDLELLLS